MNIIIKRVRFAQVAFLVFAILGFGGCARIAHDLYHSSLGKMSRDKHHLSYYHSAKTGNIWRKPGVQGQSCRPDPPFFGFEETCWRRWPDGWIGCPCQEIIIDEQAVGAMPAPASNGSTSTSVMIREQAIQTPVFDYQAEQPPVILATEPDSASRQAQPDDIPMVAKGLVPLSSTSETQVALPSSPDASLPVFEKSDVGSTIEWTGPMDLTLDVLEYTADNPQCFHLPCDEFQSAPIQYPDASASHFPIPREASTNVVHLKTCADMPVQADVVRKKRVAQVEPEVVEMPTVKPTEVAKSPSQGCLLTENTNPAIPTQCVEIRPETSVEHAASSPTVKPTDDFPYAPAVTRITVDPLSSVNEEAVSDRMQFRQPPRVTIRFRGDESGPTADGSIRGVLYDESSIRFRGPGEKTESQQPDSVTVTRKAVTNRVLIQLSHKTRFRKSPRD